MCLLEVKNLTVGCGSKEASRAALILQKIHLKIRENRLTCLLGESGAGKSLLARAISGLLPPEVHMVTGEFFYRQRPISYAKLGKMRGRGIFYAPQNGSACLNPVLKIKNQFKDIAAGADEEVREILMSLGLKQPKRILNAYPHELSGGEGQRCLLAMALLLRSDLLILDEPFNSLDSDRQRELTGLLENIRQEHNISIFIITHHLAIARATCHYGYVILAGSIVEEGVVQQLLSNPRHRYTREITTDIY